MSWEWCREFVDRECIYRADENHPPIPAMAKGATYTWQFYMRRATYNAEFARRIGLLFWDRFKPEFERQQFQICSCIPSGPPIGMAIQSAAAKLGITVNHIMARREPKGFGLDNWFDGRALNLPVMLVDDAAGSAVHMKVASARVQIKLRLPLHINYFSILNKVGVGVSKAAQHTENYVEGELVTFFTMNDFCKTVREYVERYGERPKWTGYVG